MIKILDIFRGTVALRIKSGRIETALNIFAGNDVEIWDIRRETNDTMQITVYPSGYKKIAELEKSTGAFEIERMKEKGAPPFLRRIKKRYVLLAGCLLSFVVLQISSLFIWQINVSGNETVSSSEILSELEKLGVGIGANRLGISQEFVSNQMLINIPELSWLTVNTHGSRAEIVVREETPRPELKSNEPADVYAAKGGIITKTTIIGGKSVVAPGDTVAAGDLLVTGDLRDETSEGLIVRAEGEIMARTWYEFSAVMPAEELEKTYTGEEKTRKAVLLGGKRINLYFTGGNPWASYDKITKYNTLIMPGGAVLPVTVVEETYSEYTVTKKERPVEEVARVLKARLLENLMEQIGDGGVLSTDYTVSEKDGAVTVTLYAECEEQIGETRPLEVKESEMTPSEED